MRRKRPIRSVIFDFDGVINDSASIEKAGRRIIQIAKRNGVQIPEDIIKRFEDNWGKRGVDVLMASFNITKERAEDLYRQWEKKDIEEPCPLVKGAKEVLRKLALVNYFLSILTSRNRKNTIEVIDYHGIQKYFKIIQTLQDWPHHKPDPKALDYILKFFRSKYRVYKTQHVFVGDTPTDWSCAKDGGVEFIAVTSGMFSKEVFLELGISSKNMLPSIAHLPVWLEKYN